VAPAAYPGSVTEDDREREQDRFAELRRTEDPRLRDELVEEHLWLARHCSRRFAGKGEPRDDLEQVASLALVKSVDRFDPSFGVRFSTFAVPTIMGELRRHFRDRTWSVRVTRRLKDLHLELKAANELLSQDLGRAPTVDELAEALDVTVDEVLEALEAGASYRASSLVVAGPDDDEHALDLAADDEELGSAGVRVALAEAMRTLPDRERRVVYLRFYLGLSQSEIAERIGVSQVHVSRILRASLSQLEEELGSPDLLEQ
jgi:RNA polymerase sigma-B factor